MVNIMDDDGHVAEEGKIVVTPLYKTDIPVLVCAASADERGMRVALGSRPARAMIVAEGAKPEELDYMRMAADIPMGTNARASEAYRRKVAPVLMERAVPACLKR